MAFDKKQLLGDFLLHLAESLDISDTKYAEAEDRYNAVASWLGKDGSSLAGYSPDIYPQGSFRLGTVIKPLNDKDEYDIDLVCQLKASKKILTQKDLKQLIGDRLRAHDQYRRMLDTEEGRRCWTLNYADGAQFHMDILPAIPDEDFILLMKSRGVSPNLADLGIAITDTTSPIYETHSDDWPKSNPRGYAEWFRGRMKVRFEELRKSLAEAVRAATIEEVPEHSIKTPLQRSIQILKRHRDMMFTEDSEDKPISIIITTLAAHAYNNQADLVDAILSLLDDMPKFIESRGGVAWVANPVNPLENFADKWAEHPQREEKFRRWLSQVSQDLRSALEQGDLYKLQETFKLRFGERMVNEALKKSERVVMAATASPTAASPRVEIRSPDKPWTE